MQKIAIITEGQTELIFIRNMLVRLADLSKISFECLTLHARTMQHVPWDHKNSYSEVHFQIVNVGNDDRVLTHILKSEENLYKEGFDKIVGVRDMYSREYKKFSPKRIDEDLSAEIISNVKEEIDGAQRPQNIKFFFSIMEIESWIVAMYNLFEKIDEKLTLDHISNKLKYDLKKIDPQKVFFKPSSTLKSILSLAGLHYDKHLGEVENLCKNMDDLDYLDAIEDNRCFNFKIFLDDFIASLP